MKRAVALPVVGLLVLLPGAQSAWLQYGLDAARTNVAEGDGPAWPDVAWRTHVPGSRVPTFAVLDGSVYISTANIGRENASTNGLFRLDLATGVPELFVEFDSAPRAMGSDGQRLFVTFDDRAEAHGLSGGAPLWTWPFPELRTTRVLGTCNPPAVRNGTVYLGCAELGYAGAGVVDDPLVSDTVEVLRFVAALDAQTGEPRWLWMVQLEDDVPASLPGAGAAARPLSYSVANGGLAIIGPYVLYVGRDFRVAQASSAAQRVLVTAGESYDTVWVLDESDGSFLWSNRTTPKKLSYAQVGNDTLATPLNESRTYSGQPTGTSAVVYLKLDDLVAVNPAQAGAVLWSTRLGEEDATREDFGTALALGEDTLYAASTHTVYAFDRVTHEKRWSHTLDPESLQRWAGTPGLLLANKTLYARSDGGGGAVWAFDAADGTVRWKSPGTGGTWVLSDGLIVTADLNGNASAFGRTAGSLRLDARASSDRPGPGEEVRVDLSGTAPGAQGPASEYRADWGDDTATEWGASPVLSHVYGTRGDFRARFEARNAAGQTSSEVVTFYVGQPAPVQLNPVQEAFAPEHQNLTLFLLGLAVTGVAAAPGVARLRRRRQRFQRELHAIEQVHAKTKARPAECEAALAERRARVRGLVVDGKLDEAHAAVLRERIDELGRGLRLGTLDERFDFLPHGMVKTLREMLEDGRISAWERRHFLDALERDALLMPEQKAKVRALIDEWFARDAGDAAGRAPPS